MEKGNITEEEILQLKAILINSLAKRSDKNYQRGNKNSSVWRSYSTGSRVGQQVYRSFTDEQLLNYLVKTARDLNHAPSQKETFWVLRDYIKLRFGKWPYALKKAGLSNSAGKGGMPMTQVDADSRRRKELLKEVREKAYDTGRLPHSKEMPEVCEELKKQYPVWGQVLEAADINPAMLKTKSVYKIQNLEPAYKAMLKEVETLACRLGRTPIHGEVDKEIKQKLIKRCGSWRNALYQIGLEPVVKSRPFFGSFIDYRKDGNRQSHSSSLSNCFYKVLNLDEEEKNLLVELDSIYHRKKRPPEKKDMDKEKRVKLQQCCGSWANALYQIGIEPKECRAAAKGGKKNAG